MDANNPPLRLFLEQYYGGRIPIEDLTGWRYEVAECHECGFIWQVYILGEALIHTLYSEWISPIESAHKKKSAGMALRRGYAEEAMAISLLLRKPPEKIRVMDYGMGWGEWCRMAGAFGYSIFGYELSLDRCAAARAGGISVVDDDDIKTMQFEFINCEQVLEHVSDPVATVAQLAQSLVRGGYLRIAVPDGARVSRIARSASFVIGKNAVHPLEHVNCFTKKTLMRLGASTGLAPLSSLALIRALYSLPRLSLRHMVNRTALYFLKI